MVRHPDRLTSTAIFWWVVGMVMLGLVLAVALVFLYVQGCPLDQALCEPVRTNPPWTILSAVAATPAILLTWVWRTAHKQEDIRIAQEQQITGRYVGAVELLNSDGVPARLGGIYALEHIVHDSSTYYPTIVNTLSAFVRHAPDSNVRRERHSSQGCPSAHAEARPEIDVQAALSVLGALGKLPEAVRGSARPDLQGAGLAGADLYCAHLKGAVLRRVDLRCANLQEVSLEGANLESAILTDATFNSARLEGVIMTGADLQRAHFESADLTGAILERVNLQGAHLCSAALVGAVLQGADLADADLEGANLRGAQLEGTKLGGAKLGRALYDDKTKFPEDFDPVSAGMTKRASRS